MGRDCLGEFLGTENLSSAVRMWISRGRGAVGN